MSVADALAARVEGLQGTTYLDSLQARGLLRTTTRPTVNRLFLLRITVLVSFTLRTDPVSMSPTAVRVLVLIDSAARAGQSSTRPVTR